MDDEVKLINWDETVSEMQPDGTIHVFDMSSGRLLSVLGKSALISAMPVETTEIMREDGSIVVVPKNMALDEKLLGVRAAPYSRLLTDVICSQIAGGMNLKKICEHAGMPSYAILCKWRREHPEFDEALIRAHEDQADYFGDMALEAATKAYQNETDVDTMRSVEHYTNTLWKKAKVHRPQRYGDKLAVGGDANMPLQIIINTGIRRPGDEGYIADESKKLQEKTVKKEESDGSGTS